jgi:hypothetical protein
MIIKILATIGVVVCSFLLGVKFGIWYMHEVNND